jgi:hypothetical protein
MEQNPTREAPSCVATPEPKSYRCVVNIITYVHKHDHIHSWSSVPSHRILVQVIRRYSLEFNFNVKINDNCLDCV